MKLKGDLDSVGLDQLFQTLAAQRATGVLTVTGPFGQKIIAMSQGEIAIVSDRLAERSRLGDLLIARGRLTEVQLDEALKLQRTSEQRVRLGDLLIRENLIKPQDIEDSLKFQFEEELFDLFTWKNATFEFDGSQSVDDACALESDGGTLQRMHIEPQAVIAEASRRMGEWKQIEQRLPTPYLCFKLTPKGEELSSRANTATQQILKLLKEGRTIETTVKRSCMGRFNVCKAIVKLLDEGWIFPYPGSELRILAGEHRAQNRFSDALYIYRRLLDSAPSPEEQAELERHIEDTLESIRKMSEAGQAPEGLETVSYKEAADRYKRGKRNLRVAVLAFLGIAMIGTTITLSKIYTPRASLADEYKATNVEVEEALGKHEYEKAGKLLEDLYRKLPEGPTKEAVQEQMMNLPGQSSKYIDRLLTPFENDERVGQLDKAEAGYKTLLEKFPDVPQTERMKAGLERIAEKRKNSEEDKRHGELTKQLKTARAYLDRKDYTSARKLYQQTSDLAKDGTPQKHEIEAALAQLKEIEDRSGSLLQKAETEVREKRAEKALDIFAQAAAEWPDLVSSDSARRQLERVKSRLAQLKQEVADADATANRGNLIQALESFKQIQRDYAEFELVNSVDEKIKSVSQRIQNIDADIAEAQKYFDQGDKQQGRRLLNRLLKENGTTVSSRKIEVPISIVSYPAGAAISLDGKDLGVTPKEVRLPLWQAFTLKLSRTGYESIEKRWERLPEEFELAPFKLRREAVRTIHFEPGPLAPPMPFGNEIVIFHGPSITALDRQTYEVRWTIDKILDEKVQQRPNSNGTGPEIFVADKSWWYPRVLPEIVSTSKFLLPLRTREILEISTASKPAMRTLLTLPVEPVGRLYYETSSLLGGKPLFAVGSAEGKIRLYEFENLTKPLWERQVDPTAPAPAGTLLTGLIPRARGSFVAVAANGHIVCLNTVDGSEQWNFDVKGKFSEMGSFPATASENLAALVHAEGKVTLVDLNAHDKVWELPFTQAMDEAVSAQVASDGVYVINREGVIKKLSRARSSDKPEMIWKRPLDGTSSIPLHVGKNIYAATQFGTIYAISGKDGSILWDYHTDQKPTHLLEIGNLLYITTSDGLLVLSTE